MGVYRNVVRAIGATAVILTINSFSPAQAQSLAVASAESAGHKAIDNINNFLASHKCKSQADAGTIASLAFEAEDAATMLRTLYTHEGLGSGKTLSKHDTDVITDLASDADAAAGRIRDLRPCPPQTASNSTAPSGTYNGAYIGLEFAGNWGQMTYNEYLGGALTNTGKVRGKRDGFGLVGGYNFRPWDNNIVVGPYGSVDFIDQNLVFMFPNTANLGTTTRWVGTLGVKGGFTVNPFFYGLVGISFLNQDRVINFATSTSSNTTTPGFTLGLGAEVQPQWLQVFGRPLSLFVQYQHTWWQDAKLNNPSASPGFNYVFRREDDTVKVGVNLYFSSVAAPSAPPTKALITK